jgi:hypothetical protein
MMELLTDENLERYAMVSSRNACPCLYGPDRKPRASPFTYPIGYDRTCFCCKCLIELRRRRKAKDGT